MAKVERRTVITKYQGDASSLQRTLRSIDKSASQTAKGMARVNDTLRRAQGFFSAVTFGASFVIAARNVNEFINAVARIETLDTQLRGVTDSTEEFARSLDYVRFTAEQYGLSQEVLLQNYSKFIAAGRGAGFSLDALESQFTSVATAAAAFSLSATDVDAVILGWQQSLGNAVINMEDLRQVVDRLPGGLNLATAAFADVSGRTDLTSAEFKKLVADGKVLTETFLPALSRQLEDAFSEGAVAGANTYRAAVNRLSNSFTDLKRALVDSGLLDALAEVVEFGADAVNVFTHFATGSETSAEKLARLTDVADESTIDIGALSQAVRQANQDLADMEQEAESGIGQAFISLFGLTNRVTETQLNLGLAVADAERILVEQKDALNDVATSSTAAAAATAEANATFTSLAETTQATVGDLQEVRDALREAADAQKTISEIGALGTTGGVQQLGAEADLGDVALNMRDIANAIEAGNFGEAQREITASADALSKLSQGAGQIETAGIQRVNRQLQSFQTEVQKGLEAAEKFQEEEIKALVELDTTGALGRLEELRNFVAQPAIMPVVLDVQGGVDALGTAAETASAEEGFKP